MGAKMRDNSPADNFEGGNYRQINIVATGRDKETKEQVTEVLEELSYTASQEYINERIKYNSQVLKPYIDQLSVYSCVQTKSYIY